MSTKPLNKSFITFSIEENKDLKIKYIKQDHTELREINPYKLRYAKNGNILLVAFDHEKQGWRSFSIDKIQYVKIKDKSEI